MYSKDNYWRYFRLSFEVSVRVVVLDKNKKKYLKHCANILLTFKCDVCQALFPRDLGFKRNAQTQLKLSFWMK